MHTLINVLQIVVAVLLVVVILLQVKGQGGGLFGSAEGSYRTRRGVEKALFQFTITLVGAFIVLAVLSVREPLGLWPF